MFTNSYLQYSVFSNVKAVCEKHHKKQTFKVFQLETIVMKIFTFYGTS